MQVTYKFLMNTDEKSDMVWRCFTWAIIKRNFENYSSWPGVSALRHSTVWAHVSTLQHEIGESERSVMSRHVSYAQNFPNQSAVKLF